MTRSLRRRIGVGLSLAVAFLGAAIVVHRLFPSDPPILRDVERFLDTCPFDTLLATPVTSCLKEPHREFWLKKLGERKEVTIPSYELTLPDQSPFLLEELFLAIGSHPMRTVQYGLSLSEDEHEARKVFKRVEELGDRRYPPIEYSSGCSADMVPWNLGNKKSLVLWLRQEKGKWRLLFMINSFKRDGVCEIGDVRAEWNDEDTKMASSLHEIVAEACVWLRGHERHPSAAPRFVVVREPLRFIGKIEDGERLHDRCVRFQFGSAITGLTEARAVFNAVCRWVDVFSVRPSEFMESGASSAGLVDRMFWTYSNGSVIEVVLRCEAGEYQILLYCWRKSCGE